MRIETREIGAVEVAPGQILDFVAPLLGFERYRKFALLPVPEAAPFHWLQSLQEKELAFLAVSAEELEIAYRSEKQDLDGVGASSWDEVECWVLVVVPEDGGSIRVNLRAPVVVHTETKLAAQIIVRDEYPVSYTLRAEG